ncbi:hypothetical protein EJ02DRAFT_100537 [Clathrospora elynae]|uniref:Uncharacterized protein n=1 Tax=Clathrospora elynae TaxID=706981 RepID=A0A6A5SUU1_9PLEO|nr:hypothetical protein EJ02DRAFT_100537 [Clathrospora elynae]
MPPVRLSSELLHVLSEIARPSLRLSRRRIQSVDVREGRSAPANRLGRRNIHVLLEDIVRTLELPELTHIHQILHRALLRPRYTPRTLYALIGDMDEVLFALLKRVVREVYLDVARGTHDDDVAGPDSVAEGVVERVVDVEVAHVRVDGDGEDVVAVTEGDGLVVGHYGGVLR